MKSGSYIICTAPRSGSTLLCRLLAATGVAGDPESLFYRPSLDDWMNRMDVDPGALTGRDLLEVVFQAAIQKGRGETPVFGLRQQRPSFEFLCQQLANLHPSATTDLDRIERTFGPTHFIHMQRQDKVEQAVSLLRAQQSGLWHVAADGSEWERTAPPHAPSYNAEVISEYVRVLDDYDRSWNEWFDREGIEPIRVSYDELSEAPNSTLRRVLDCLGLDPRAANGIEPEIRKMADSTAVTPDNSSI